MITTESQPARPAPPPGLPAPADVLGRAGGENFTVASRLLPARSRAHLLAIYGYARFVDQLGDAYPGDRSAALDWLESEVDAALADPATPGLHPLVATVATSARTLGVDRRPLVDLIDANRADQTVRRYATFDDLVGYCRLSANPVGRLVLAAFAVTTPERVAWSDAICTGLQLAEHWQDVAEDAAAERIYLPTEDLDRFEVDPEELRAGAPAGPRLRALMAFEAARARRLLDTGLPLVASLTGRPKAAVAGFWAGGRAALDALAHHGFDPLSSTPRPRRRDVAAHLVAALCGRAGRRP